jgi:hypothetical protein
MKQTHTHTHYSSTYPYSHNTTISHMGRFLVAVDDLDNDSRSSEVRKH